MPAKPYHHGNLRQALIDAAIGLIQESGPEGFTLREVARRAHVSHTAPYRHFRDKNDLLAAVAEQGFTDLSRAMAEAARGAKALDRLQRLGVAYVTSAVEHPAHFRVMFGMQLDPKAHPAAWVAGQEAFQALVSAVTTCQEANVLPKGHTLTLARVAWSLVHGIAQLAIGRLLPLRTRRELTGFVNLASRSLAGGLSDKP